MTEYTVTAETSVAVAITAADLLGVTQVGVDKKMTGADIAAFLTVVPSAATWNGPATFNNGAVFSGQVNISNSGASTLIGTTLSSKVGFWGAAGTTQRTNAAQVTMTISGFTLNSVNGTFFTTTVGASQLWAQVAEIRQTLVDMGVWAGA